MSSYMGDFSNNDKERGLLLPSLSSTTFVTNKKSVKFNMPENPEEIIGFEEMADGNLFGTDKPTVPRIPRRQPLAFQALLERDNSDQSNSNTNASNIDKNQLIQSGSLKDSSPIVTSTANIIIDNKVNAIAVTFESIEQILTKNIVSWIQSGKHSNWNPVEYGLHNLMIIYKKVVPVFGGSSNDAKKTRIRDILNSVTDKDSKQNLLHLALRDNKARIVECLLELGADPNQPDKDGLKPLHYAAIYCREDTIKLLINAKADSMAKGGQFSRLPIHYACCRNVGAQGLVNALLRDLGDNNDCRLIPDSEGAIPIYLAAVHGNNNACKILLSKKTTEQCDHVNKRNGDTVLHVACREKNPSLAMILLDYGANVNAQDRDGFTPLHVAAWEGDEDMVHLLYQYRANPNIYDKLDRTPVHIATERGNTAIVDLLVERYHASTDTRTLDGSTLIHIASLSGNPETAELFLKKGVPLLMPNKKGAISLHSAAKKGNNSMVQYLLKNGMNVDSLTNEKYTSLHIAVMYNQPEVIRTLLGYGANVNAKGGPELETPLHIAARIANSENSADMLIKSGADVNAIQINDETALHIAAKTGNSRMVNLLLGENANPLAISKSGETPLHIAVRQCHLPIVIILMHHVDQMGGGSQQTKGPEEYVNRANHEGETAIHLAACLTDKNAHVKYEEVELMKILLKYGGDLKRFTVKNNETPLHYNAKAGDPDVLRLIVQITSKDKLVHLVNQQDKNLWSPLLVAADSGNLEIAKLLLQNHARVDIFDEQGKAALHLACESGNEEIVDELMSNNAYVNIKSKLGITPLHLAALNGYDQISVNLIRKYGANLMSLSLNKKTPLHLAAQSGQVLVCAELLKLGADPNSFDTSGMVPIHLATENNHAPVVKLFLLNFPDLAALPTQAGNTCAHIAAMKGSIEVMKELMKFNSNVVISYRNKETLSTPLHLAARGGHIDIIKLLLDAGASPKEENKDGYTPLHLAARYGRTQVLQTMLQYSPALLLIVGSRSGLNPLHVAAKYGNADFVREMLEKVPATIRSELTPEIARHNSSANRDKIDFGLTALHFAAQYGHENIVRLLLNSKGVKVNTPTLLYGYIPLHLAALGGHNSVASILLSKSSDQLHIKDKRGRDPLHLAASKGHYDMVTLLISQGSEIDSLDNNNWTPLHYGAKAGFLEVTRRLVLSNASTLAINDKGEIPLCLSVAYNHLPVFSFLIKKEHPVFPLLQDRKFVFDMMVCGRLYNNQNIDEYILNSPAPLEVAVIMAKRFAETALREKERAKELLMAVHHCENMAYELMSIAVETAPGGANAILRAADHTETKQFIQVLIASDLKTLVSHPSIQIWLTQIWYGSLNNWKTYKFILLFLAILFFPPLWLFISLPWSRKYNKNPIIKFLCYLVSHCYFILLLISITALPFYQVYESISLVPKWNEWILYLWIIGNFLQEIFARTLPKGIGWIRIIVLVVCAVAIIIHFLGIFFTGTNRLIVLYSSRQVFSIALVLTLIQFLEFLSFDDLFGPWAIIIRELIKDMGRFLVVLFLFLAGFSFMFTTIYLPMVPLNKRVNVAGEEITSHVFINPIESFELLFFSLFGLVSPDMLPPLNQTPAYANIWTKLVFGVFLMVTFIVLINLLIAMMSDTYQRIKADSDLEWKYGRAQLIMNMERQPAAPSPINIFTKIWTYTRLFQEYGTKIFTLKREELLNEEERIDHRLSSNRSLQALGDSSLQLMSGILTRQRSITSDRSLYVRRDPLLTQPIKDVLDWKAVGKKYLEIKGTFGDDDTEKLILDEPVAKKSFKLAETVNLIKELQSAERPHSATTMTTP